MKKPVLWEELTGPEIKELSEKMDMVILPVGATEQHGPHLPVCTDSLLPTEVAYAESAETSVPVLQTLRYLDSPTHKRLDATIWLRPETLHCWIYDVCKCVYEQGFHKILIINGHGTNVWPLHTAWSNLRFDLPSAQIKIADATINQFMSDEDKLLMEKVRKMDPNEYHAATSETSRVLYHRPDLVHMDRAIDWPMKLPHGALFDYRVDQISETGVCGRPTKASKELGEKLIDSRAHAIAKWIEKALQENIPFPDGGR